MFPHGHHHHSPPDEEDRRPPQYGYSGSPPPPQYGYSGGPPPPQYGYSGDPPPPQYGHVGPSPPPYGHSGGPAPPQYGYSHSPAPPVQQYGLSGGPAPPQYSHGAPAGVSHVSHHGSASNDAMEKLMRQPTVRIYCKANEHVSLAVRNGKVVMLTTNKHDESQHWIKDLKYSTKVKDEEGYPAFSLINKETRQALKHSLGQSHPVPVTEYEPEKLDESVLWTESRDVGGGWRCIRMVNNIYLNFDVFHGDKQHGGVRDGSTLDLWAWTEGDNQRWKIATWKGL